MSGFDAMDDRDLVVWLERHRDDQAAWDEVQRRIERVICADLLELLPGADVVDVVRAGATVLLGEALLLLTVVTLLEEEGNVRLRALLVAAGLGVEPRPWWSIFGDEDLAGPVRCLSFADGEHAGAV
jgi:hypothetical protein